MLDWLANTWNSFLSALSGFAMHKVLPAVIVAVIGILAIRIVLKLLKSVMDKSKLDPQLVKLVIGVARPVLYMILCLIVATALGIDVTSVVLIKPLFVSSLARQVPITSVPSRQRMVSTMVLAA